MYDRDADDAVRGIELVMSDARHILGQRPGPAELCDIVTRGGLVVDIRPVDLRRRDGVLPGALIIDRNVLEWRLDPTSAHRIAAVNGRDQVVVLVCDEGYASTLAAVSLRRVGLRNATDLDGGYQAWKAYRSVRANADAGRVPVVRVAADR